MTNREQRRKDNQKLKEYLRGRPLADPSFSKIRRKNKDKADELGMSNKQYKKYLKKKRLEESRRPKMVKIIDRIPKSQIITLDNFKKKEDSGSKIILPKGVRV